MLVGRDERVVDEGDTAVLVVDTDIELSATRAAHDVRFDLLGLERALQAGILQGRDEREKVVDLDSGVDL